MIEKFWPDNGTVWSRWYQNAVSRPDQDAIVHWVAGEAAFRWTFSSLLAAAQSLAASLLGAGVKQGDVCAILLRHHKSLYPLYLAVSWMGAIPSILAYPNARLHPDKFREGMGFSRVAGKAH